MSYKPEGGEKKGKKQNPKATPTCPPVKEYLQNISI